MFRLLNGSIGAAALALVWMLLAPVAGMAAVDVTGLTHLDGSPVPAAEVSENALFVVFSTWSPKCRGIIPRAEVLNAKWNRRAQVFLVSFQEDAGAVEDFLAQHPTKIPVLLDPDASFSKKHKITYLPFLLAVKGGSPAFRGKMPEEADPVLEPIFE